MTLNEALGALESVVGELNHRAQVAEAEIITISGRLTAVTAERDAAIAEIARLTAPPERLPISIINDLWIVAQLRLLKLSPEVQARWQPVNVLVESQLREAAQSGGVRRTVPWLGSVIRDALEDKLVTQEELNQAGLA
mgnify:CR=1 FL=1